MTHHLQEWVSNDSYLMNLDHFAACHDELAEELAQVRRHVTRLHCLQLPPATTGCNSGDCRQ